MAITIPSLRISAREASGLELVPARGLGTGGDIADVLAAHTRPAPDKNLVLAHVGSSDAAAEEAVSALKAEDERLRAQVGAYRESFQKLLEAQLDALTASEAALK